MRGQIPRRPTGFTPEAIYDQSVWDRQWGRESELRDSATIKIRKTSSGIFLDSNPGKGGAGLTLGHFRVKSVQGDYLTCRTWDGTTEGGTDVYVAKEQKHRHSISSESIEGVAVTYVYASRASNLDGQRTASAAGYDDQIEIIVPIFIVNDLIFAEKMITGVNGGDSAECGWMDTNRAGRCWGQITV